MIREDLWGNWRCHRCGASGDASGGAPLSDEASMQDVVDAITADHAQKRVGECPAKFDVFGIDTRTGYQVAGLS